MFVFLGLPFLTLVRCRAFSAAFSAFLLNSVGDRAQRPQHPEDTFATSFDLDPEVFEQGSAVFILETPSPELGQE